MRFEAHAPPSRQNLIHVRLELRIVDIRLRREFESHIQIPQWRLQDLHSSTTVARKRRWRRRTRLLKKLRDVLGRLRLDNGIRLLIKLDVDPRPRTPPLPDYIRLPRS